MNTVMRRATALAAVTGAAVLATAVPAFAHVSVQPGNAAKGGYSTVAFKVPNEDDKASTIKVEVNLPSDHPIASVSTQPVPGWTVQITKAKLKTPLKTGHGDLTEAVTKITWSGGTIKPGEFQQFPVSLGPLPEDTGQLVFKTLQTYDNKEVVRWIEEQQKGEDEPEHPAPVLALSDAADDHGQDASTADGEKDDAKAEPVSSAGDAATENAASADGGDTTARVLGIVGIVVGVLGAGFGVLTGRRRGVGTPSA
ncbi:YcnI family copper-binding membrane protein [Actinacidiphila sp. bgisy160]|uniref:YcnI family copper-binding membrane protein n=1 Tax=Actinacidiphila sp. bgisy160 TaxID=3413796 RepID=UPI003D732A93